MHTFLWHDYETFGANPRRDRPAQFAAIRTDSELNEIRDPMMWYCKPAPDFLPDPISCLITGITPQQCLERGIPEYRFAQQINQEFAKPNTIGVGYNTIRFDDEITRFMLWRNLIDPYAREWQNNCGRWDILDMLRTAYALRPDGIVWPTNDEGKVSFRLEHLSAANHLVHESAHDALSDVRATIALARLVKHIHPKLFDFCFSLHSKERVAAEISLLSPRPFLHISGMLPVENGCMCIAWPLAQHPTNKNEIIVWNLAYDPRELVGLSADTIRKRMFSKTEDLPEGVSRLPIKSIHLNKSPIVIQNLKTLQPDIAERRNISLSKAMENAEHARTLPTMNDIWLQVFKREPNEPVDVDQDLYNGFVSNGDRRQLQLLTTLSPEKLATTTPRFEDARLHELLFRYRARHFSTTLTPEENQRWETLRASRFFEGNGGALTVDAYFADIDRLSAKANEKEAAILAALYDYAEQIVPVNC